jgi:SRSO17 transposase
LKSLYIIILSLFIFTGCATNQAKLSKKTNNSHTVTQNDNQDIFEIEDNYESDDDSYKIAIIFPSKVVGKYAKDAINTMMAYMLHNNIKFNFEVFDSLTQDNNNINRVFSEINEKRFTNVIALFTQDSIDTLLEVQDLDRLNLYLPLINKNEVVKSPQNIVFGAIDYKNQIETLLTQSNKQNSIFYTNNALGLKLKEYVENSNQNVKATTVINKHTNVFKRIVKNKKLRNSSLFLNTSIIKSSIILSQLRAHEANVYKILSTQLNYTPLVISLTQYPDRKNFVIANSIERTDLKLQESLALFDADIEYNWVNYATLIGMDYLYKKDDSGLFPSKIEDNQVKYNVRLYKNTRHGFKKLSSK